ncbi:MAG: CYTH domain-containing protein, partial [Rhodococcus sp. (in: high G+C Gram-positive bacteria)]|nr:CYTH domain-containing protein [Rhodococcus sp. (in: high G+C Gram-positive bacteria)]MDX5454628.1 CYTH domain-containing protein [Rhodococcus sp. (in: high G+C Gram-positive bacteria)]
MTMPPRIDTVEESERKYTVGHGQQLPDLSGLPGVDAHPEPELQQLSARYYDTDDLRLLRAGITLRRREGGHDAGWHTKLPAGTDTRTEVRFPLGDDTDRPPAELLALLRGVRRARPVTLAAALNTQRWRQRLIDEEPRVHAELHLDDLTATPEEG